MKKIMFLMAIAIVMMSSLTSCTKVHQGEFGVKAWQLGDKKGQVEHLGPGLYSLSWFGRYSIYIYPATVQQHSWTGEEKMRFQAEGQELTADIGLDYSFSPDPEARLRMYQEYKRDPDDIVQGFMRKDIASAFNRVVQSMSVEDVYSRCKDSIRAVVQREVSEKYQKKGIIINDITYLSPIDLPPLVKQSIDKKIEATQIALTRENEIATVKAEAQKKIEEARGESESARIRAEGRAKAIEIEGRALRENSSVLELKRIEAQKTMAESASHWTNPVLSAQQSQLLLGLGSGK